MVFDGDFNGDGAVNVADYTVWRDNLGATEDGIVLSGAGDGGTVGETDYLLWKSNFGASQAALSLVGSAAVPEPTSWILTALGFVLVLGHRHDEARQEMPHGRWYHSGSL